MNVTDISPYLIYKFKNEAELVRSIQLLSDNFTKNRDDIEDYHKSEKLIAAYAAFYLTTNFPKFSHCMNYLKDYENLFSEYEIVDIGVGPGTFIFAIGEYFNWKLDKIWGIETSHLMKKQAIKIKEGLFSDKDIEIVSKASLIPQKTKKRLVIFTHSFNEMGVNPALEYIKDLDPDGVLFIEPGTKSLFKDYLKLREKILADGYFCHYPCPTNNSCPLEGLDDWCHQYVKVSHDLEVSRLTQITSKNRNWQPMTLGLYLRVKKEKNIGARIIRTYPETKFSLQWDICINDNSIKHVEVFKRDHSKAEIKVLSKFLSGEEFQYEINKELENKWRIKVVGIRG